jgi:predicted ATPase/DNA-binding winged helix-turn-helix (wHTH) protein
MNEGGVVERGYRFAAFRFFPGLRCLLRDDNTVPLSPRTMSVLAALIEHHGELVTKDDLLTEVWHGTSIDENNLVTHVSALRKVLGRKAIATIHGKGYRFAAAVEQLPAPAVSQERTAAQQTQANSATNLPKHLTRLIGRDVQAIELKALIGQKRLVTLAGPSGIGKTRLAVDLGRRLKDLFPDGVSLIDLAPLNDPAGVASAAATALGVQLRGGDSPVKSIAAAIGQRRALLIFDNCEYLASTVAELIEGLLLRAPGLSVLATSQETLRLSAEQIYRLSALELPPSSATEISGFGAVELFLERARAVDPSFRLNGGNAATVAEICRRLDGIPLALEMAAARLPLLGLEGLRAGLGERLQMLKAATRNTEWRHQTLLDTVEWSHGLLAMAERQFFRRLGIFSGSFSLDATVAVTGLEADRWKIADTLGRLVDKSLVTIEAGSVTRYRMLETLRLYALERLAASGEAEAIAERHAQYFKELLNRSDQVWETTLNADWLLMYRPEIDNVRAALDWALAAPERAELAIGLAGPAARLWEKLAIFVEGRHYAERAASLIDNNTPPAAAARLLRRAGALWHNADRTRALALQERSAALYRILGDRLSLGSVLGTVGALHVILGRSDEARAALEEARDILSGSDRKKSLGNVMNDLGNLALFTNDAAEARRCYARALDLARALKDANQQNLIMMNLAELDFGVGATDRAIEHGREAVSGFRSADRPYDLGSALINLASYLTVRGDHREARALATEALSLVSEEGGYILRLCLQHWALLGAVDGRHEAAAQLVGFVDAGYAAAAEVRHPTERQIYDRLSTLLDAALAPDDVRTYAAGGARWSEDHAVAFVLRRLISPEVLTNR